jgi:hypothetical protein
MFFVSFLCDSVTNFMTKGPWDQAKFENLLTEWIVACDQPFDGVEKAEFIKLMNYARHPVSLVKLPSREGIRRRVMKMGEDTVGGIREMFAVRIYCVVCCPYSLSHRILKGKLLYLSMHGHQAINMLFWQ